MFCSLVLTSLFSRVVTVPLVLLCRSRHGYLLGEVVCGTAKRRNVSGGLCSIPLLPPVKRPMVATSGALLLVLKPMWVRPGSMSNSRIGAHNRCLHYWRGTATCAFSHWKSVPGGVVVWVELLCPHVSGISLEISRRQVWGSVSTVIVLARRSTRGCGSTVQQMSIPGKYGVGWTRATDIYQKLI